MSSYLGIDIGEKRIGLSICDISAPFPAPLTTLEASPNLSQEFSDVLKKHNVKAVVIGFPRNQNGEPTEQTERVKNIVNLLNIPEDIQIYWQDESLTSVKAEEELKKRKKHFSKKEVDSLAATFILEDFVKTKLPMIKHESEEVKQKIDTKSVSKKPKKKSKIVFIISSLIILVFLIFAALTGWYVNAIAPKTVKTNYQVITIKTGSGTKLIAQELEKKDLIKSAAAFTLFVRLNKIANLQAGTYRISSSQSVSEIVDLISSGKITTINVLIPPGRRLDQILAALEEDGYSKDELTKALTSVRDHPLLKNVPQNAQLEGYLFPDTYKIGPETTAQQLFRLMLDNFEHKITPTITTGIQKQGLTLEQAVILASIVQKEVSDSEVQRTVAQVFIKRLQEGTVLGSDVTYKYAADQFGAEDTPASSSPYNTRRYKGLPPTAISNFNISALEAVANPTSTDYNFFVAGDDGTTYFSHTIQEHEDYTRKYCTKECQ